MRTKSLGLMIGLLSIAASHTWAGKQDAVLLKEAAQNSVLVRDIVKYADETGVTLTGKISKHLHSDHYEFQDQSGSIVVEIDDDLWQQSRLSVGDSVRLIGEVDTHRYKPTDIEVMKIEKYGHQ